MELFKLKNKELSKYFIDYNSKFIRKNRELIQDIHYYENQFNPNTSKNSSHENDAYIFKIWLENYLEKTEKDYYRKKARVRKYVNDIVTIDETIKNFNYFNTDDWPLTFTELFLSKVEHLHVNDLSFLYSIMAFLAEGHFNRVRSFKLEVIETKNPFCLIILAPFKSQYISCMVGIKKIPIFDNYSGNIYRVKYVHHLFFSDIARNKDSLIYQARKRVEELYTSQILEELETALMIEPVPKAFRGQIFKYSKDDTKNKIIYKIEKLAKTPEFKTYTPNHLPDCFKYIPTDKKMNFSYKRNIWMLDSDKNDQEILDSEKFDKFKTLQFSKYFQTNSQFKKAIQLVEFLQKIPKFTLKLTHQEKKVIGQEGNVLVLGRSGTGKTTCLVLRLFAMEFLFKLRMKQVKQKFDSLYGGVQKDKFGSQDVDKLAGLHCIFVTASPVLCQEVKNYYEKLKNHVKIELLKKEEVDLKITEEEIIKNKEKNDEEVIENLSFESMDGDGKCEEMEKLKIKVDKNEDLEKKHYDILNENILKKEQKTASKYANLSDIPENEFPCFLTIKQLIFMIDAELRYPYLIRNFLNNIVGYNENARKPIDIDLYYEQKKKITNDEEILDFGLQLKENDQNQENLDHLEEDYLHEISKFDRKNPKKIKCIDYESYLEIDFTYFEKNFWLPLMKRNKYKVNSNLVWTQIYSVIKGSKTEPMSSIEYYNAEKNLNPTQKRKIYEIYCEYEIFKRRIGAFDLMDIVMHIFKQMDYGNFNSVRTIHYMMVDEVQDLPHSILILLTKLASNGLFFSGDTAQNIAKGVGFRFCDLKNVFSKTKELKQPVVRQLSINFRSHQNILNLGNSIVSLLELVFPNRIDHLKKEKSQLIGPKPYLISASQNNSIDLIFHLLNETQCLQSKDGKSIFMRPNIEFGCNQVILVRNEESKKQIPDILAGALILTIFEAKGLEFDDVILFNFFDDPLAAEDEQWEDMMKLIEVKKFEIIINEAKNESDLEDEECVLEDLDAEIVKIGSKSQYYSSDITVFNSQKKNDMIEYQKIIFNPKFKNFGIDKHGALCNELKELYTAMTRARKKLIIYDKNYNKGKKLKEMWRSLNLIDFISDEDFHINDANPNNKKNVIMQVKNKEEWKKQGVKFFNNKNFEQAMKCFEKADENCLYERSKLNFEFLANCKKLEEIEENKYLLVKRQRKKLALYENQMKLKELKHSELEIQSELNKIAEKYLENNLKLEACECYLRSKDFEKAAELYIILEMWNEAAEMYYMNGQYAQAADIYSKNSDYLKMMECYENLKDWDMILRTIHQFKSLIPKEKKFDYLKKYFPLILENLVENVDFEEPKIHTFSKKTDIKNIQAIKEEDDEDYDDYDSDDLLSETEENVNEEEEKNEKSAIKKFALSQNNENTSVIDNLSFMEQEKKEISFEKVGFESKNLLEKKDMSFEKVGFESNQQKKDRSFEKVGLESHLSKGLDDYEHLSHIDFDDEWLKSENNSIIDSILSSREKKIEVKSEYSGFECIDPNSLNPNYHIIKTKGDIFVQDDTMKKMIDYIKMFSDDFFIHLKDFRSKEILLSSIKNSTELENNNENFVMDLDNIDLNFLFMLLDILETFEQYKLCIFVCNRYTLHQRVGRYIISIAHRYSFLANEKPPKFSYSLFFGDKLIKNQQEKSFIVSTAMHNVLENINPHYLAFKRKDEIANEGNDLGINTFQGLVLLGCWKKCVYFMDYSNALALTSTFGDFTNNQFLFLKGHPDYCKAYSNNLNSLKSFEYLPFVIPKDSFDEDFLINSLKRNIWFLSNNNELDEVKIKENCVITDIYPDYFQVNAFCHELLQKPTIETFDILETKIADSLLDFKKIQLKKNDLDPLERLKTFDLASGLIQTLLFLRRTQTDIQLNNNLLIIEIVESLIFFIELLEKFNKSPKISNIILEALLIPFKITLIKDSPLLKIYGKSFFVVHKSSLIFTQIIKSFPKNLKINENLFPIDLDYELYLISKNVACDFIASELKKYVRELLFTNIPQDYAQYLNANKFIILSNSEIQEIIKEIGYFSAIVKKIAEYDKKNETSPNYKPILINKTKKNNQAKKIKSKKTKTKYDERHYSPEILKKIEIEENQIMDGFEKVLKQISKKKNGEDLSKEQYFFKIFKILHKLYIKQTPNKLPPIIKNFLLEKYFLYIEKAKILYVLDASEGFKIYLKAFNILKFLKIEWMFLEQIKHCGHGGKNSLKTCFSYLIESKIYDENGCIEEFSENIFNYLSKSFHLSPLEDKITKIEEVSLKVVVAKATNNKTNNAILFHKSIGNYLEVDIDKIEEDALHKFKINPFTNPQKCHDTIFECFYWLKKISSYSQESYIKDFLVNKRIFNILMLLIINIDELSSDHLLEIKTILKNIDVYKDFYEEIKNEVVYQKLMNQNLTLVELNILKKELISYDSSGKRSLFLTCYENFDNIIKIKIAHKSNEEIDLNYSNSDYDWYRQYKWLAIRINSRDRIIRYFKKNQHNIKKNCKNSKLTSEVAYDLMIFYNKPSISIEDEKNIKVFLLKNKFILELYEKLNILENIVIKTYYLNIIDKGLDFHYILSILNEISCKKDIFEKEIRLQSNPEVISKETVQSYVEMKNQLNILTKSFDKWLAKNYSPEINEIKLNQSKKLIALKFAKRHLYRSANKIFHLKVKGDNKIIK